MKQDVSKSTLRQFNYRERALRARTYARILMPVCLFLASATAWQDPVLGAKLSDGLTEIKPIAASYLADTPLEDLLGPLQADMPRDEAAEAVQRITAAADLPDGDVVVNRQ
ncbi:MAG: hypothetical protein PVI41_05980 [Roseobacter sp.]|jgi:hypothetical protein